MASALMTSPSALSDLLIACASFSCSPVLPDFFTLRAVDMLLVSSNACAGTLPNKVCVMLTVG